MNNHIDTDTSYTSQNIKNLAAIYSNYSLTSKEV